MGVGQLWKNWYYRHCCTLKCGRVYSCPYADTCSPSSSGRTVYVKNHGNQHFLPVSQGIFKIKLPCIYTKYLISPEHRISTDRIISFFSILVWIRFDTDISIPYVINFYNYNQESLSKKALIFRPFSASRLVLLLVIEYESFHDHLFGAAAWPQTWKSVPVFAKLTYKETQKDNNWNMYCITTNHRFTIFSYRASPPHKSSFFWLHNASQIFLQNKNRQNNPLII